MNRKSNGKMLMHEKGEIPRSSRLISPITSNYHQYQYKSKSFPTTKSIESWFETHSIQDRRVVFDFLQTLAENENENENHLNSISSRSKSGKTRRLDRRHSMLSNESSRKNVQSIVSSFQRLDLSSSNEKLNSFKFPQVNEKKSEEKEVVRPSTSDERNVDEVNGNGRYLSSSWRVINPNDQSEKIHRRSHNSSSFFNLTKKSRPEYFFISPDWY